IKALPKALQQAAKLLKGKGIALGYPQASTGSPWGSLWEGVQPNHSLLKTASPSSRGWGGCGLCGAVTSAIGQTIKQ
uniref:Uncharacterized protein n=1 Tax=Prolemur simus TaxID=1328070 RepID=A0A8C8ZIR8_PROSS